MRSKPDCFEVAFLLFLFFSLVLLIFLSLEKCHCDSQHLVKVVPGTNHYSLVKIGSVTAEIFLIYGQMSPDRHRKRRGHADNVRGNFRIVEEYSPLSSEETMHIVEIFD